MNHHETRLVKLLCEAQDAFMDYIDADGALHETTPEGVTAEDTFIAKFLVDRGVQVIG